jgi:hypothetical protein
VVPWSVNINMHGTVPMRFLERYSCDRMVPRLYQYIFCNFFENTVPVIALLLCSHSCLSD